VVTLAVVKEFWGEFPYRAPSHEHVGSSVKLLHMSVHIGHRCAPRRTVSYSHSLKYRRDKLTALAVLNRTDVYSDMDVTGPHKFHVVSATNFLCAEWRRHSNAVKLAVVRSTSRFACDRRLTDLALSDAPLPTLLCHYSARAALASRPGTDPQNEEALK
jgi:hypothetical protein